HIPWKSRIQRLTMRADEQKLRVGLDLRPTEQGFKAHYGRGTGRYTAELTGELRTMLAEFEQPEIELEECSTQRLGAGELEKRLYDLLPYGRHTVEQQILLPRRIDRLNLDLFHFFAHVDAPCRLKTPYVVTVLDLIPLKFADLYRAGKPNWRFKLARFLELQAIKGAAGIIAISEATKRDVVEILGIASDKIAVTPLAAGASFTPVGDNPLDVRCRFGLPGDRPVVLYVGGIDARKNVPFLVEAFSEASRRTKAKPILALAGRYESDDKYPGLLETIRRCEVGQDVKLLGFVADSDLPDLYRAADLFAFPSLYEGFGLPVLEAMSCGTPVIASNNSSIPEVVGSSGLLLDDGDKNAWVSAICDLLESEERKRILSENGLKRAKSFSWRRTAELTCDAYSLFAAKKGTFSGASLPPMEESRRVSA
ncbi:MAG: glycosyltransferase family 4 protein, partial [Bdellovibrionales bacterium]|nr:glycosyltransferase family 4 protein [Bdellovibrionales bacterium]